MRAGAARVAILSARPPRRPHVRPVGSRRATALLHRTFLHQGCFKGRGGRLLWREKW
jgi:hypothetical protein